LGRTLYDFYSAGDQGVTFSVTQVRWRDPKWRKSDRHRRSIVWLGDLSRGRIRDRANTIRAPSFSWGPSVF